MMPRTLGEVVSKSNTCQICEEPRHLLAMLCPRCKGFRDRLDTRAKRRGARVDRAARERALEAAWDPSIKMFRCHFSGVALDNDPKSPWHLTFDHRTPRDESDIVVCAALLNDMKSDLAEPEFRKIVAQLAERFAGRRADIDRFKPLHWHR